MIKKLNPVIVKEIIELSRDKLTLLIILLVPSLLLFIYGYAISLDVKEIKTIICDLDRSNLSIEFVNSIFASKYFELVKQVNDEHEIDMYIQKGKASAGVLIYPDFSKELKAGRKAHVLIVVDGSNAQSTQSALSYFYGIFTSFQMKVIKEFSLKYAIKLPKINLEQRIWYNPFLESSLYLIPGLIALVLMIMAVIATTLSIVKEKESGTIEQMVITPLSPKHIVLGKIIPYFFLSIIASTLMVILAQILFDLPFKGSILLYALALALFLIGALGLGLLISAVSQTQQMAFSAATFATMLPTMLLSNFIFPLSSTPKVIQWISYIIPARYFIAISRAIILKGTGAYPLWKDYLALLIFAVVALTAGIIKIGRKGLTR